MAKKYKPAHVENMVINPYEERNILNVYPKLKDVIPAVDPPDIAWAKYFKYLSFLYDKKSPLAREFRDIKSRKLEAREETGYEGEDYPPIVVTFIQKIVKSREMEYLNNLTSLFSEYSEILSQPIDRSDYEKVSKAIDTKNKALEKQGGMIEAIDDMMRRLYDGDEELVAEHKKDIDPTPENIAKLVKKR